MKTEEQLVYELLNTVSGGELSNDSKYSERLTRSFLRKHRASKLNKFYHEGITIGDEVFQDLGTIPFELINGLDYQSGKLPATIKFDNLFGMKADKFGYNIPITDEESYWLSQKNIINKKFPKACVKGNRMLLYIGMPGLCTMAEDGELYSILTKLQEESKATDDVPTVALNIRAVLYDPSDAPDYDWTKDPYPAPAEVIDEITTSALARDFNLMIRTDQDQVGNMKDDNLRYNDAAKIY